MSARRVSVVVFLVVVSFALIAALPDELPPGQKATIDGGPFKVSVNLPGENNHPTLAVSSKTGDILVVWTQIQNDAGGTWQKAVVYAVLCRRAPNGVLKIGKPKAVSGMSGLNLDPSVAYNPEDDSYMVVWTYLFGENSAELRARPVDAKGKPEAFPVILTFDFYGNRQPIINYISLAAAAPRDFATYLVVWDKRPTSLYAADSTAGIYSLFLDASGSPYSAAKQIVPAQFTQYGQVTIFDMVQMVQAKDGSFFLAAGRMVDWPVYEAWVYTINPSGDLERSRKLADISTKPFGIAQIANKLFMVTYEYTDPDTAFVYYYNQGIKRKLGFKGARYQLNMPYIMDTRACLAAMGENGPTFQFGFDNEKFYGWEIDSKGNVVGNTKAFFEHKDGYYMDNFVVAPVEESARIVFVAWYSQQGSYNGELWCCAFTAQ
jgi:hypothetical protein